MDKWVQSEADAYTLEVKANLKLGNKGTFIDFRLVPHRGWREKYSHLLSRPVKKLPESPELSTPKL
jgi:hypothetical protein